MKFVNSQNRFIATGIIGLAVLAALYIVLFMENAEDAHHNNEVDVHDAWVRATAADGEGADMEGVTSAAYMEIANHGGSDQRLISVTAEGVGMAQIHQTVIENDVARMEQQTEGVLITAGDTIELEPMGLHIMLMNLEAPLMDGETLTLTLHFEDGQVLETTAPIRNE